MNNENYDCSYFIAKFEAIPEDQWLTGIYSNPNGTRFCALGHCGEHVANACVVNTKEGRALSNLFNFYEWAAGYINDGRDARYQQPTPKLRILAALRDIQRQQEEAAEALTNLRQVSGDTRIEDRTPTLVTVRTEAVPSGPAAFPSQPVACVHLWLEVGVCMICSATKPVQQKELA